MKSKLIIAAVFCCAGCTTGSAVKETTAIDDRFGVIADHAFYDPSVEDLSDDTRRLLGHLIEAADLMDSIYLDQVHPMNHHWIYSLRNRAAENDAESARLLEYVALSHGPWDIFDQQWILPDGLFPQTAKLAGYNLYPTVKTESGYESVAKERLDAWLLSHPEDEANFKSPFTVIRTDPDNPDGFVAIPYAEHYREPLHAAAWHLERAAAYTEDKVLQELLRSRADAFRSNNYNDTEVFWIRSHDSEIQLLIGPYEESVDDIWGVKRGFGARIGFKDPEGTANLQSYKALGSAFQDNLPVAAKFHPDQQKQPFFTVWRQIYATGDSRNGVQTLGQKLTNDRSVTIQHGARQNFYRNSQTGKCEKILLPIARIVLIEESKSSVVCDSFFKATLHHEYAHALGIAFWYPDWDNPVTESRKEVNDNLPTWGGRLEELKADTLGFYNRHYMISNDLEAPDDASRDLLGEMYATMIAGYFRSVRFGLHSSYALNAMIELNHLIDIGAIEFDASEQGRVRINAEKIPAGLRNNAATALMMQVNGDDDAVGEFYRQNAVVRPETQKLLDRISGAGIPRDLRPVFPALGALRLRNYER